MEHFFIIEGCRETGNYVVYESMNGSNPLEIYSVKNMRRGGLKVCRENIGNILKNKYGYALNQVVPHQCVKPDRQESKNPWITNSTVKIILTALIR